MKLLLTLLLLQSQLPGQWLLLCCCVLSCMQKQHDDGVDLLLGHILIPRDIVNMFWACIQSASHQDCCWALCSRFHPPLTRSGWCSLSGRVSRILHCWWRCRASTGLTCWGRCLVECCGGSCSWVGWGRRPGGHVTECIGCIISDSLLHCCQLKKGEDRSARMLARKRKSWRVCKRAREGRKWPLHYSTRFHILT